MKFTDINLFGVYVAPISLMMLAAWESDSVAAPGREGMVMKPSQMERTAPLRPRFSPPMAMMLAAARSVW